MSISNPDFFGRPPIFFRLAADLLAVINACREWTNPTLSLGDIQYQLELTGRSPPRATVGNHVEHLSVLAGGDILVTNGPGKPSSLAPDALERLRTVCPILAFIVTQWENSRS